MNASPDMLYVWWLGQPATPVLVGELRSGRSISCDRA